MDRLEVYRQKLRDAGLRATLPRVSVLGHLTEAGTALSHAEVAEGLGSESIDRATVYRNLIDLSEAGLLRRIDLGDHVWRFAVAADNPVHTSTAHPHFICSSCGSVACLPESAVKVRSNRRTPRALRQQGLDIQIRGLCDVCR
jgi:Fur family ferric uptake transcriptional regulator